MANEQKAVSPAVAAIVIIIAIVVIGLIGWYFVNPRQPEMTGPPGAMPGMKDGGKGMPMPPMPGGPGGKGMPMPEGMKGAK